MAEMSDDELSNVAGQAYVIQYGPLQQSIPDLTERNVVWVSDAARTMETDYPGLTAQVRQDVVIGANSALVAGKLALAGSVATTPGVGTLIAPVILALPAPQVRFQP